MHVEARALRTVTQNKPMFSPNDVGTNVEALKRVALPVMDIMTIADWDTLKREFHQKLQELKQSEDDYRQGIMSDLETKIAALEESFRPSNPCSGNIRRRFGVRPRDRNDRSAEQTQPRPESYGLKKTQDKALTNLVAREIGRHGIQIHS